MNKSDLKIVMFGVSAFYLIGVIACLAVFFLYGKGFPFFFDTELKSRELAIVLGITVLCAGVAGCLAHIVFPGMHRYHIVVVAIFVFLLSLFTELTFFPWIHASRTSTVYSQVCVSVSLSIATGAGLAISKLIFTVVNSHNETEIER